MGNCCSRDSAPDQYVQEDPGFVYIPDNFQANLPHMSTIVPSDDSSLRPFHDHLIAKVPKVLANAGMRATIELAAVTDAPDSTVFWRITVLQEDEDEDIHAKISDVKHGIEASIAYLDKARLDCHPQGVRWFVAKPNQPRT